MLYFQSPLSEKLAKLAMWAKSGSCFNFNRQGPYFEKMTMKGDRVPTPPYFEEWVGEDDYDRRCLEARN